MPKYSDIKPGDTVKGAGGEVVVNSVEAQPNGLLVFRGARLDSGDPASTWGWSEAEIEQPMDWFCPECCAIYSDSGTCESCDVTLVQGDPDGAS